MASKKTKSAKKINQNGFIIVSVIALSLILALGIVLASNKNESKKPASASDLLYQKEVAKKQCDTKGSPVINITQQIVNSVDSGEGGNNWAFDTYNRQIKVYKQDPLTYCALVDYEGKFDAKQGQQSPGDTAPLTGNEDGTFKGGYRAIISGVLKEPADSARYGNLGAYDYQCDISGNCPGAFNWMDKYFNTHATGFASNLVWWGWTYKYKNNTWINASDGNSGDVL